MAGGFLSGVNTSADAPVVSSRGTDAGASNPSRTAGAGPPIGTGTSKATPDPMAALTNMRAQSMSPSGVGSLSGAGLQSNYSYQSPNLSFNSGQAPLGSAINPRAAGLINNAKSWLGVPYVYGGTSRAGVDCSGFTQAVYQSMGINIGRDTSAQLQSGKMVGQDGNWQATVAALKPGDLIFYGQPGASGPNAHVVMYIGNGQVMQAPHSGTTVSTAPLFSAASASEPFLGARSYM